MSAAKKKLTIVSKIPGAGSLLDPTFTAVSADYIRRQTEDLSSNLDEARLCLNEILFDQLNIAERGKIESAAMVLMLCLHKIDSTSHVIRGAADDLDSHLRVTKEAADAPKT